MGFDALLGNERLTQSLSRAIARGHISHFYLITGPAGAGKHTLARLLAAAILCAREDAPCMVCNGCRKVMAGLHPDFITVDDPEKKTVPVALVREVIADSAVLPNEAPRKVYCFPRAQDMGASAQNALLKLLEEPPAHAVFLLLSENADALLETVRSRCTLLRLSPLPEALLRAQLRAAAPQADAQALEAAIARSGGYLGQALRLLEDAQDTASAHAFAQAFAARDALALTQLLVPMEKTKRDELAQTLEAWRLLVSEALLHRSGLPAASLDARALAAARDAGSLAQAARILEKATQYLRANVSSAAVCAHLAFALRI